MAIGNNYLDLYNAFVNEIVGHPIVFVGIALIVIAFIATRHNIPDKAILTLCILFMLLMSFFMTSILVLVIVAVAILIGRIITLRGG